MSAQWTRRIKGISVSRWSCYEAYIKGRVEISWPEFKEQVVKHNPELKQDNWIFKPEKEYCLPIMTETVAGDIIPEKLIDGVAYLSQLDKGAPPGNVINQATKQMMDIMTHTLELIDKYVMGQGHALSQLQELTEEMEKRLKALETPK